MKYTFIDNKGTFTLKNPENTSYLYFPIASEKGLKSVVTPNLAGDSKMDQNTFLLEPESSENLHNNKSTRNFWLNIEGKGLYSAVGVSAGQMADKFTDKQDESELKAGIMWHEITRNSKEYGIECKVLSFVDVDENVEVMKVTVTNAGKEAISFVPTAAIPLYGRSATNIRDHRHVTSLLHRIKTTECGVEVTPTLSFDERGHQFNHVTYYVCGFTGNGEKPVDFYPEVETFLGEGGSFERPLSVLNNAEGVKAGVCIEGIEAVGGLHFAKTTLEAGQSADYIVLMGISDDQTDISAMVTAYNTSDKVAEVYNKTVAYWDEKINVAYHTGSEEFDSLMHWISFQPILRRIYGCSFLPHHDYGKGGRGWRDLWQDCLALLIMNPGGVRQMLIDNFGGVRMDGTNATIIGTKQGEFIADRNNITRVWMDHGVWPYMTTELYINQTGDVELLDVKTPYFKDKQVARGTVTDTEWNDAYGQKQKDANGNVYEGTVLEHLLLQNLTSFYEVGEHNEIRLRGADWNDALDMAEENGESVAFTNAVAGNLVNLANLLEGYSAKTGRKSVTLLKNIEILLNTDASVYDSVADKNAVLEEYTKTCIHNIDSAVSEYAIEDIVKKLKEKSEWMMEHIRKTEWVDDGEGNGWFNGYYDNSRRRVEGKFESGVRMMLTGQVFSIMAGTATKDQTAAIAKSADKYLYSKEIGGYRLNTDFHEVKHDMGRAFGFSYGDKENGAVFCHMAVMYANSLYKAGFAKEGYKALGALVDQSLNFDISRIYPGVPEYFNGRGRGMYHYLTGAASWYMLTVITQMYGVRGDLGNMLLEPKLLKEQFDAEGKAGLELLYGGRNWNITYINAVGKDYGEYSISDVKVDGQSYKAEGGCYSLALEEINKLSENEVHNIVVTLS